MIIIDRESHHQVIQWSLLLRRQGCIITITITNTNLPFDLFKIITLLAPILIYDINIALNLYKSFCIQRYQFTLHCTM